MLVNNKLIKINNLDLALEDKIFKILTSYKILRYIFLIKKKERI